MSNAPDPRSDARERALYLLYESTQKELAVGEVVAAQIVAPDALTRQLVDGVADERDAIDADIASAAEGWTLDRMPLLDLNLLRIAVYELRQRHDVPVAVVINEAVGLAKRFSTDNSGRFVNGVLATLAKQLRPST